MKLFKPKLLYIALRGWKDDGSEYVGWSIVREKKPKTVSALNELVDMLKTTHALRGVSVQNMFYIKEDSVSNITKDVEIVKEELEVKENPHLEYYININVAREKLEQALTDNDMEQAKYYGSIWNRLKVEM